MRVIEYLHAEQESERLAAVPRGPAARGGGHKAHR